MVQHPGLAHAVREYMIVQLKIANTRFWVMRPFGGFSSAMCSLPLGPMLFLNLLRRDAWLATPSWAFFVALISADSGSCEPRLLPKVQMAKQDSG